MVTQPAAAGGWGRRGFSLASVLLLTAVMAIFSAAVTMGTAGRDGPSKEFVALCAGGGSILGGLVGTAIGLSQVRRIRGFLGGLCAGTISGAMAGVLLAVPKALPATIVGALVLLVFGGVARFFSQAPPPS